MSEQTQEVILKLVCDTADGQKGLRSIGDEAKAAGDKAEKAGKQLNTFEEAQRRLVQRTREKDIQREMDRISPKSADPPALPPSVVAQKRIIDANRERQIALEQWKQTPWHKRSVIPPGMRAGPIIATAAAAAYGSASAYGAAGQAANEAGDLMANRPFGVSHDETVGNYARQQAEALPILGGFVKSIGEASRALTGLPAAVASMQQGLAATGRQLSVGRSEQELTAAARLRTHSVQMEARDTGREAASARGFADSLTGERLGRYRGPQGDLFRQADMAGAAAAAARDGVADRQAELGAGQAELGRRRSAHADARSAADQAASSALKAERDLAASREAAGLGMGDFGRRVFGGVVNVDQAEGDSRAATAKALGLSQLAGEKGKQVADQQRDVEQKLLDLKQAQERAAAAELTHRQAQLSVNQQIMQQNRQGAVAAGTHSPQSERHLTRLAGIAEGGGWNKLTVQQRQELLGDSVYGSRAQQLAKERGQQDPAYQKRVELANKSLPQEQREFAAKPLMEQENEVTRRQAANEAGAKEKQAAAFSSFASDLAEIIKTGLELAIEKVRREVMDNERDKALVNRS